MGRVAEEILQGGEQKDDTDVVYYVRDVEPNSAHILYLYDYFYYILSLYYKKSFGHWILALLNFISEVLNNLALSFSF